MKEKKKQRFFEFVKNFTDNSENGYKAESAKNQRICLNENAQNIVNKP